MTTATIIKEIDRLPLADKLLIMERTIQGIRAEKTNNLEAAAEALYEDYKMDADLTAFTQLDSEPFL